MKLSFFIETLSFLVYMFIKGISLDLFFFYLIKLKMSISGHFLIGVSTFFIYLPFFDFQPEIKEQILIFSKMKKRSRDMPLMNICTKKLRVLMKNDKMVIGRACGRARIITSQ